MLRLEKLKKNLDNKFWLTEDVALVVLAKKLSRNKQGKSLNLFVLDRTCVKSAKKSEIEHKEAKNTDELSSFINLLNSNIDSFKSKTHFQVAVGNQGHWTAFDFIIENKKVSVLCIDAADDGRGEEAAIYIAKNIKNSSVYYLQPDKISIQNETDKLLRRIQTDNFSCSRMTLAHLFMLSEMDFSKALSNSVYPQEDALFKISPQEIPADLAKIFSLTQDPRIVDSLDAKIKTRKINSTQTTLQSYLANNANMTEESKQFSNYAIHRKKEKYKEKVSALFETYTEDQINEQLRNRQGYHFLKMTDEQRQKSVQEQISRFPIETIISSIVTKRAKQIQGTHHTSIFKKISAHYAVKHLNQLNNLLLSPHKYQSNFFKVLDSKLTKCETVTRQRIQTVLPKL